MRATNAFRALCLGAVLGLTGCISAQHDHADQDRYGHYEDYDRYDVHHVYDAPIGVYVLAGHPHHYSHGGWYYRHVHGYWERCARLRGGHWSRVDHHYVPQRLHARYEGGHHGWKRDERDTRRDWRREQKHERKEQRWERAEERRDRRDDQRDWKREGQAERREQKHERREERRREGDEQRGGDYAGPAH